jgi:hypothetical protein
VLTQAPCAPSWLKQVAACVYAYVCAPTCVHHLRVCIPVSRCSPPSDTHLKVATVVGYHTCVSRVSK